MALEGAPRPIRLAVRIDVQHDRATSRQSAPAASASSIRR
jgi:hypothetical protein